LLTATVCWEISWAVWVWNVLVLPVSDVVATLSVLVPTVVGLTTPWITTLTVAPAAIDWFVNSVQVTAVVADTKQLPIDVVLTAGTVTDDVTRRVRSVPAGKVMMIWLPAACDMPPVEDVVNPTV
jgi:hypothetical protein